MVARVEPESPESENFIARAIARAAYKFNSNYAAEVVETLAVQKPENVIPVSESLDEIIRYPPKKTIAMEATEILKDFAGQDAVEDVAFVLEGAAYCGEDEVMLITDLFRRYKSSKSPETVKDVAETLRYAAADVSSYGGCEHMIEVAEVFINYLDAPEERIRSLACFFSELFEHNVWVEKDDIKVLKAYKDSEEEDFDAVTGALRELCLAWEDEPYWEDEKLSIIKVLLEYAGSRNARRVAWTLIDLYNVLSFEDFKEIGYKLIGYRETERKGVCVFYVLEPASLFFKLRKIEKKIRLTEEDLSNILDALKETVEKIRGTKEYQDAITEEYPDGIVVDYNDQGLKECQDAIVAVADYIFDQFFEGKAGEAASFSRRIVESIRKPYAITTFTRLLMRIEENLTEKEKDHLIELFKGIVKSQDAIAVANYIHNQYLEGKARKAVSVLRRIVESTGEPRAVIEFIKGQKFFSFAYN